MHLRHVLTLLVALVPAAALAAPPLELGDDWILQLDAQLRPRLILDTGRDFVDADAQRAVVTQRSRVGVGLTAPNGVAGRVVLQDVRLWGEELDTLNDFQAQGFDLFEAHLVLPVVEGLELKAGRQAISFDAQRLVGAVDWSQRARSFDALRLSFEDAGLTADLFYAKVATPYPYVDGTQLAPDTNTDFAGAHLGLPLSPALKLAALYLFDAKWDARAVRHTVGGFATGAAGGLSYTAEGYWQGGRVAGQDLSAFLAAGRIGYALEVPGRPSVTAWGEYVSGDGTVAGTFDTLYATNHKFYGEMDFFLNLPVQTAGLGLVDLGGRLAAVPVGGATVHVDWHHFLAAEESPAGERRFGDELDFKVTFSPLERVSVRALYGLFLPGEALRARPEVPDAGDLVAEHFGYLTLDVKI